VRLSVIRAGHRLVPRKIRGTHFFHMLSQSQGHSAAGRFRSIEKSSDLVGNRTHDLPACSIVPQPTTLLLSFVRSCYSVGDRNVELTMQALTCFSKSSVAV
jgi:hypothetical protein